MRPCLAELQVHCHRKKRSNICFSSGNREWYIANFGPTDLCALTGSTAAAGGTTSATLRLLRAWTLAHAAAAAAVADSGGVPLVYAPGDASVLAVVAERRWAGERTAFPGLRACSINQRMKPE